jgi:hypothetical protein
MDDSRSFRRALPIVDCESIAAILRHANFDQKIQRRVTTHGNGHITQFMSIVDRKARKRIQALEERAAQRDREVAELSSTVSRLAATVEAVRASSPRPSPAVAPSPPTPAPSAPSVTAPKPPDTPSAAPAPDPRPPGPPAPQATPPAVAVPPAPAGFASLIVADFPGLFAEFRGKRFALLWRGSRDGFSARDFHGRCAGHAPTLTLIQDTDGNIFGGFTPVEWESRQWSPKADPSLKSFLFTLKNPHNFPARKFELKDEEKDGAIVCDSLTGPYFCDIGVSHNCNANTHSFSELGYSYANDTGLDGWKVLTDSENFTVKEIEVFEIAD